MRQVYRIELSGSFHLRGFLRLPGDSGSEGRLVDISTTGASLAFLPGSDPKLEVGTAIEMLFAGPNGVQVATRASVRNKASHDEFVRYGFEFNDIDELNSRIPILMRAVFNRRRAPRVSPDEPVELLLESEGVSSIQAKLINVSVSGVAIEVPFVAFESYEAETEIGMTIELPGSSRSIFLRGRVRSRRMEGPAVHLGIEFMGEMTEDFESQVSVLEDYVSSQVVLTPYVPG